MCCSDSVCHELCSECQLTSPEGLAGAGRATSKIAPSHGCEQDLALPHHMVASLGLFEQPHNTARSVSPPGSHDPREQDRSCSVFSDLATEVTLHHFCNILLVTQVSPVQCDSWGASGMLTTIVPLWTSKGMWQAEGASCWPFIYPFII